ncbi:MAG: molybdopterin-dependent oxidoreductase [Acidimicrobiales bacterium]|nr:molybdopterin-dependent oxidoreductase [Acidimicrobiales bacterium]MCB9394194.1 molybdopterin-dependent oxidoreductase [Acidimicrobiaceae bacterium]
MGTTREISTFCRICEPSCGLVARVEDGRLTKLSPDRAHPVTKGFSCHKGLAAVDLHHDPDRLDHPQLRSADGTWRDTGWDEAMAEVARRWRAVVDTHGPNSTAAYIGNPMAFNALGSLHVGQMLRALGVRRSFSSGTQDCANKFVASEAVFGSSNVHPIPDLDHTDLCLVIGENPRASQASFYSIPNVLGSMRRAAGRGARFVFVNPRRIETPEQGIGDTVLIRPDTDVWFLAALLHEIDRLGGFRDELVARHGRHLDGLRRFIAPYSPDATEAVTGVPADTVRELARAWVDTPRASVHASTGINMGRQGTLAYWLVHMLSFVTGRLDVEGGNLKSDGFYPNARSGQGSLEQGFVDTEFGRLRRGSLPGTLMSHAILDSDEPIRAMIVVAGNPLLSIAGQQRLRKAFEQLELLVVIDIYPSATAELAHVVLPSTDMYERDDLNIVNIGTSAVPFAQYTPAVVEPAADRKPEWWIAHRVLQELGAPSLLDDESPDPWAKWRHMLAKGSGLDLADLQADGQARVLPAPEPGRFFDQQVHTVDGLVDCCPPGFAAALERCTALWDETRAQLGDGRLRLIHRRDAWMHNTWFANLERMKRRGRTSNPLGLHPDDADRLGLSDGDEVVVTSDHGEVTTTVEVDDALMAGVVSMVHGWGHTASPRLRVAHEHPGANPNALLPIGEGSFEPLSSQAHMTGIPVDVRPLVSTG